MSGSLPMGKATSGAMSRPDCEGKLLELSPHDDDDDFSK